MKIGLLLTVLILPSVTVASEFLRTKTISPICRNQRLIENYNSAMASGIEKDIISARTIINLSKCGYVPADQVIDVKSNDTGLVNANAIEMSGKSINGFMSIYNLVDPIQEAKNEAESVKAEEKKRQDRELATQQRALAESTKENHYKSLMENNKINCNHGFINGLIAGAGGTMFTPLTLIERAYSNESFKQEALNAATNCVVDPTLGNSYCTGLIQIESLEVSPRNFTLNEYRQYGDELIKYITFNQVGKVDGLSGEFQFFARKADFSCQSASQLK